MSRSTTFYEASQASKDLLKLIENYPRGIDKHQIARELFLGDKKQNWLKSELNKLLETGSISLKRGKFSANSIILPQVTVIEVTSCDENGDLLSTPLNWTHDSKPPLIFVKSSKRRYQAPGPGDRLLARLTRLESDIYEAEIIRPLLNKTRNILGIISDDGRIQPVLRGKKTDYHVAPSDSLGAAAGELVLAEVVSRPKLGRQKVKILELLGSGVGPQGFSHIAIHQHGIPFKFSNEVLEQAAVAGRAPSDGRTDLRSLPLVTIDGENARDFDDAIFAEPWQEVEDGWHVVVAIADVAWYVRPETALDNEARKRGNSVYFPDRAVPMLPEILSNGWCSLKPDEDRPCLAVHLWIDSKGNTIRHKFERAVIRSHAQLTYRQVQAARDGCPDTQTAAMIEYVINPIFGAYECFLAARQQRKPLELHVPEVDIRLDDRGHLINIVERPNIESYKLIEEFMIAANVAAATALECGRRSLLYRVHEDPPIDKLQSLRDFSDSLGLKFSKGRVLQPSHFNKLIEHAVRMDMGPAIGQAVLRTQSKACYTPENFGHFGLRLRSYCHFTSPIRRYADLLIHRTLISVLNLGEGGSQIDSEELSQIGNHLSITEQRAARAEWDTIDRFCADYLKKKIGQEIRGKISSVTKFGLFVYLDGFATEGLVPMRYLPNERFHWNEKQRLLKGRKTGVVFQVGDNVNLVILDANPINSSITLKLSGFEPEFSGMRYKVLKYRQRKR